MNFFLNVATLIKFDTPLFNGKIDFTMQQCIIQDIQYYSLGIGPTNRGYNVERDITKEDVRDFEEQLCLEDIN